MDRRPVSGGSWKLAAPHDKATQGLVVSGFASLPTGRALFLEFRWPDGGDDKGRWLQALEGIAPVTDADGEEQPATALAFTFTGLARMGLPAAALASFDAPFREGMLQEDRLRRIGDRRYGQWQGTVIDGGPVWSGNTPQRGAMASAPDVDEDDLTATGHAEETIPTATTVHALLMLFDPDADAADARAARVEAALAPCGIAVVHRLPLNLRPDAKGIAREHFGFADGVSQPVPYDDAAVIQADPKSPRDPWNGIPLGDILLGYTNSHNEVAPSPMVAPLEGKPDSGLSPHPLAEGFLDLGLDGSYLVVRQLRQNVAAFWTSVEAAAAKIRADDPAGAAGVTGDWLADRVIGRDRDGKLLCPLGVDVPQADAEANSFGFFDRDRRGHGCPVGSHVRRANPRDGLAPNPGDKQTLLEAANNHRLLRRGRKYGDDIADRMVDDKEDRGLLFIAVNTDLGRQFEFVQQTWLLNRNFATLYDETDPLLGPAGTMTIPGTPIRRICEVDTFVQLVGGDYFFLPSLLALKYLASL